MLLDNPVFVREVRSKLRGRLPMAARILIGSVVGLFVLIMYWWAVDALLSSQGMVGPREAFVTAFTMQAIAVWASCPSAAANAVSQEREQQTWDLLICSRLSPLEILGGKFAARILPAAAIVAVFLPFQLICIAQSAHRAPTALGITPGLVIATYAFLVLSAAFLVTLSLFMSITFRRTPVAIACSMAAVFVLVLGTAMATQALSVGSYDAWETSPLLWGNPVRIAAAICSTNDAYANSVIPMGLGFYAAVTALLGFRMVMQFRVYAVR